jgi:hypothetical protein
MLESVEAPGFRERLHVQRLRLRQAVLRHHEGHGSGLRFLQRQLDLDLIGLGSLPFGLQLLAGRILEHDAVDAADAVRAQMHGVLAPDDQGRLVARRELPATAARAFLSRKVGPW